MLTAHDLSFSDTVSAGVLYVAAVLVVMTVVLSSSLPHQSLRGGVYGDRVGICQILRAREFEKYQHGRQVHMYAYMSAMLVLTKISVHVECT